MLTYVLGPFLSIFPKPWRKSLPFAESVDWAPSTVISGLVELVGGIIAIAYWYLYAMTTWVDRIVDAALSGKLGAGTTVQAVGSVALVV